MGRTHSLSSLTSMTHLEIIRSIICGLFLFLFLAAIIYNSMISSTYERLWKQAEQDNKWLRTLLQVEYEAQGKRGKVIGPQLGEESHD